MPLSRRQPAYAAQTSPLADEELRGPGLHLRRALVETFASWNVPLPSHATTHEANLPINGSIYPVGGFETPIYVGSPPQRQLVQIDTGSSDLLVAQVGCAKCPSPKYDPSKSTTSRSVSCHSSAFKCKACYGSDNLCFFNNTYETCDYADPTAFCSLLGTTYYDVVSVAPGSPISATVGLGGIREHQGAFDNEWTNMPGVMGMGFPAIAGVWANNTLFGSWVATGAIEPTFGMCIDGDSGHLFLGGIDDRYFSGQLQYTPILKEAWYVIGVVDAAVDGTSLGLPASVYNKLSGGTILDSGTNTFVITGEAYAAIEMRMEAMCDATPLHGICDVPKANNLFAGGCFAMTAEQVDAFPSVSVTLKGTKPLALKGSDYLIAHPSKDGAYCLGIQSSGMGGFTILGNVFQQAFYISFEQGNRRLGFAPVNGCGPSISMA